MSKKDTSFEAAMKVFKLDTSAPAREQIEYIDIDKIDGDPRNFYELSGLEELAANIELCGLQQPIRVRTSPQDDGRVVIVSGHRRRAALAVLVEAGREEFRQVPCIREQEAGSAALQELRLIYANSDTRKLSSADLAKQAERVEELLYQLKEEGMEFPGRMRDHVAQACQTSKSKLARLKVIREKLMAELHTDWGDGLISDQAAYALARMPDWMQQAFVDKPGRHDYGGGQCEEMLEAMTSYSQPLPERYNGEPCGRCSNGRSFLAHDVRDKHAWNLCKGERCCMSCAYTQSCKFVCAKARQQAAEEKTREAESQAQRDKKLQERSDALLEEAQRFWRRVNDLCTEANVNLIDAAKALLPHYQTKTVEDIVSGEFDGILYSRYVVGLNPVDEIVQLCTMLGCSADVLLGLGPDAGATKASWQTGKPRDSGLFYARFELDGMEYDLPAWYNAVLDAFYHSKGGAKTDGELIAWYPLPMDEEV